MPNPYDEKSYPDAVFASMGMFIIDEIHFPNKPSQYNVIGGGGTFSILGSRMVLTKQNSLRAGWILDIGNDFPQQMLGVLQSWNTGVIMRYNSQRQCSRGWNMYGDNDLRSFKYLTPKLRIDVPDIIKHSNLLHSKSYHLLCSPERCTEILGKLRPLRPEEPVIVWEPIPDDCNPQTLPRCLNILKEVDILSPNAQEAAAFFGLEEPTDHLSIETIADRFLPYMTKNKNAGVVLRCGALGCFAVSRSGFREWFPAYHSDAAANDYKVIDPTGGGNTFIGALATAYVLSQGDWKVSCVAANIASGAAIEQIGMPELEDDTWNGTSFPDRVRVYLDRHPELSAGADQILDKLGTQGLQN
ncbi:unnamed protein product [Kuraishia capsulata CBS 1993]|uniref:Carbohydrate kinase PfkB domain-containing protein n=1 Tax=Kuraishia capsulata CBS 1993 TaxID=1382522 RepID=W6MMI4_9ASCO|nr:uncharacterized protein KUCA_T00003391001 [Kuraishia capsulata CBS 1993]CDK27413.1 unnamed protein product [Kuraishia capsulata CBS 1993]